MQPTPARLCPKCASKVQATWRVCPECATSLGPDSPTETQTVLTGSSSSSIEEGRFPAGTVLAGRYRILGLAGRGGMGEVYRAYDLILSQAVALKFLGRAAMSEAALARFRNEVRIARQVSHPNVCRVYDIGFIEGSHFLSMEYLDGEDLASLIRRIGRLPQDKAIEFSRRICAGLAAAHERGVLHRDLKPANIMIDGRGQVRITDFGLAALAQEVALGDIRSGTPAYMSPEQKTGREVTTRSDIYSLGLTLYEMFTGKRRDETGTNPTEIVKDLDPTVEAVILRCLAEDPKRRPVSALSVAMALPGGDPIAAALAAGETPSPEMVAASDEKQSLTPTVAGMCLVGVVMALAFFGVFYNRYMIPHFAPLEIPPEGLAFHAREVLRNLGYAAKPKATAYGFDYVDRGYVDVANRQDPARFYALLASHRPAVIAFWYRQHQSDFLADSFLPLGAAEAGFNDTVVYDSPPNTDPGMIRLRLDAKGRLIELEARPTASAPMPDATPDWARLFAAAELDPGRFTSVEPRQIPPVAFDSRAAWDGTFEPGRTERVHLEAASWKGRPVYFSMGGDWQSKEERNVGEFTPVFTITMGLLFPLFFGGAAILAWLNLQKGRGDRRGARQIAVAVFLAAMLNWIFTASHVAGFWEFHLLLKALGWALLLTAAYGLLYLGIEPHIRRHWPDSLISWSRLQAGRLRDPLVASHILAGIAAILVSEVAYSFGSVAVALHFRELNAWPLIALTGVPAFLGTFFAQIGTPIYLLMLFAPVLRLFARKRLWLADGVAAVLASVFAFSFYHSVGENLMTGAVAVGFNLTVLWLLRRFGLVAAFAALMTDLVITGIVPIELGSWYGGRGLVVLCIPALAALWATWVIASAPRRQTAESA
jgi:serine/threonine-protein kinase